MDGSNRHHHERALTGLQRLGPSQKVQFAFQDVKALFMSMMDMRRRGGSMRRHFKFRHAQCSPRLRPILLDHHVNRTERKRASFSRLQYDSIHENILSCLACSNKQQYKHLMEQKSASSSKKPPHPSARNKQSTLPPTN